MSRRKRRTFAIEQKAQAVRLAGELDSVAKATRDLDLTGIEPLQLDQAGEDRRGRRQVRRTHHGRARGADSATA